MVAKIQPFLMFQGDAGGAIAFYQSVFADVQVLQLEHYDASQPGPEGGVRRAEIVIAGQTLSLFDSPTSHGFSFTPSISLFVVCESEAEIERLAGALGEGGQALMPLGSYGFSRKFAWISDRFGVSWQLNLA